MRLPPSTATFRPLHILGSHRPSLRTTVPLGRFVVQHVHKREGGSAYRCPRSPAPRPGSFSRQAAGSASARAAPALPAQRSRSPDPPADRWRGRVAEPLRAALAEDYDIVREQSGGRWADSLADWSSTPPVSRSRRIARIIRVLHTGTAQPRTQWTESWSSAPPLRDRRSRRGRSASEALEDSARSLGKELRRGATASLSLFVG